MGLPPDSRDIEPIREDHIEGYNNEPVFVGNDVEPNEFMQVDDEDSDNNGYLRLRMNDNEEEMPADDSDSSGSDVEDENEFGFNVIGEAVDEVEPSPAIPAIISADSEISAEVWNSPRPLDTIELSTEKTEQILNAMSKFSLPNVPDWANEVDPSELIKRIRNKEQPSVSSTK